MVVRVSQTYFETFGSFGAKWGLMITKKASLRGLFIMFSTLG